MHMICLLVGTDQFERTCRYFLTSVSTSAFFTPLVTVIISLDRNLANTNTTKEHILYSSRITPLHIVATITNHEPRTATDRPPVKPETSSLRLFSSRLAQLNLLRLLGLHQSPFVRIHIALHCIDLYIFTPLAHSLSTSTLLIRLLHPPGPHWLINSLVHWRCVHARFTGSLSPTRLFISTLLLDEDVSVTSRSA
jgi:hypothetical protein